jgi:hypothetical protein
MRALSSERENGGALVKDDKEVWRKLPRDGGWGKNGPTWDSLRRRRRGLQGRPQKAPLVRSLLFEWFSVLRNSVCTRIPPKLVAMKASTLVEDYIKECLQRGVKPDPPMITSHWMRGWMRQFRVSLRRPNRKYKVPLPVLEERLVIFWLNLARLRRFIQLMKGHDPSMTNLDQSPYHKNESGSQNATTLSVKGAPIVVLKEGHADTRSRWSACTITCSDFRGDVPDWPLPGLELMFKADGERLQMKLEGYIHACGYPRWLSVVTSPKASYREEHVLTFLETHLEPWSVGRGWRILLMDAYKPQMTDNIRRLAWTRGYVVAIHGGGATGITQSNDTDLHQHQRRRYTAKEMAEMLRKSRFLPGLKMPSALVEDNIDWMVEVWLDRDLHAQAAKGYKYTGATNALNGSEDYMIAREARTFWDKLGVSEKRDGAVHDVEVEVEAGRLRWGYDAVYSLVAPFPKRGHLDATVEHQDDEDPAPAADEEAWSDDGDDEDGDDDDDDGGGDGAAAVAEDDEGECEGDGGSDADGPPDLRDGGDDAGGPPALRDGGDAALGVAQADALCEQSARINALQQAIDGLEANGLSSAAGALRKALRDEHRASVGTHATDPGVANALRQNLAREEQDAATQRKRMRHEMAAARAAKKARAEAKEMQARVGVARKRLRDAEDMQQTQDAVKTFTPAMLGADLPRAGGVAHRKRRMDVLSRLAAKGAPFSGQGRNDWAWFVEAWDAKMVVEHGREWGQLFAQQMQHLAESLAAGSTSAIADFMASETRRVLHDVSALRV